MWDPNFLIGLVLEALARAALVSLQALEERDRQMAAGRAATAVDGEPVPPDFYLAGLRESREADHGKRPELAPVGASAIRVVDDAVGDPLPLVASREVAMITVEQRVLEAPN